MKKFPVFAFLLIPFSAAVAQDATRYACSIDEVIRRVEILSEPGVSVPCEVHYYKDTEDPGSDEVLWSAQNETGYCEARAAEFIERLEGMGWTCRDAGGAPVATEPAETTEADDTDALAPAEEDIEISEVEEPR